MADGTNIYEPQPDGSTVITEVDSVEVDFGGGDKRDRQRMALSGHDAADPTVAVKSTTPADTDPGLVVRTAGITHVHLHDDGGAAYDAANPLPVSVGDLSVQQLTVAFPDSEISTANDLTTPLAANQVYQGTWEEITKFAAVSVVVMTDAASAVNGAVVEFSDDGTDIVRSVAATIPANVGLTFIFAPEAKYFRLRLTNGPAAQTTVSVQTILHYQPPAVPQVPLAATTTDISLAQMNLSHLKGRYTNGLWLPLLVDSSGRLVVDVNGLVQTTDTGSNDFLISGNYTADGAGGNSYNTVTIAAGASVYGPWEDVARFSSIVYAPNASGLINGEAQFSADGVNVLDEMSTPFVGAGSFIIPVIARYARAKITNLTTGSITFSMQSMYKRHPASPFMYPAAAPIHSDMFVSLGKNITTAAAPDGSFSNVPLGGSDPDNTHTTALGAAGSFTGTYKSSVGYESALAFVFSDQPLTTCEIQWSSDGVNPTAGAISTSAIPVQSFVVGPTTYYLYLTTITTMVDKYYRIHCVNGATPTTLFEAHVWLYTGPFAGSFGALNAQLSTLSTALLTRSVVAAYDPDGNFNNIRTQGRDSANSTNVPLNANAVWRGKWFPWQASYVKSAVDMFSDVAGTLYLDMCETDTPVDGDESSVTQSLTMTYDPNKVSGKLLRRHTPIQAKWYRYRYVNGNAAQSQFFVDAALLTADTGLVQTTLDVLPGPTNLVGRMRTVPAIPDGTGNGTYHEVPVDSSGVPQQRITKVDDDLLMRGLPTTQVRQFSVGTTPVQLDSTKLANRRAAAITNLDATNEVYIGHAAGIAADSGTFPVYPKGEKGGAYGSNVDLWAVVKNTGGAQNVLNRVGTTAGGTGTNVGNVINSDNSYASLAQGQTATLSGFTAGTANTIAAVKLVMEAAKQSGQFETVAFQEVQTGSAGNVGSVATTSAITGGTKQTYLAFITRNSRATVTGVSGLGLTWTQVRTQDSDNSTEQIDCWIAKGTATAGVVTATFSATAGNCHISVLRYYGVDQTTPVQASNGANGNSNSPANAAIACTNKGVVVYGIGQQNRTATAYAAGYIERSNEDVTTNPVDGLAVAGHPITATGTDTPSATLSGAVHWQAIAVSLSPAAAYDPVVTVSYQLVTTPGATSAPVTISFTADTSTKVDITADRSWVASDIANITMIATATSVSGATPMIDQMYVEVTDSTANVVRISLREIA